jgi:glycerophosphoryl diester phosphodiesterase
MPSAGAAVCTAAHARAQIGAALRKPPYDGRSGAVECGAMSSTGFETSHPFEGRAPRADRTILLDPRARLVIGHRGNRAHAPENTLASLLEAVALGVDAVEFDLRVARDGALVVMHDATLERTTDGSGPVEALTAAQLGRLDAGAKFTPDGGRTFPWRGRGARISTFDEVIESLPRSLPCIIELKTRAATEPVRAAIRRHGIAQRVIVAGFDPEATRPLIGAGFALGASTPDVVGLLWPALLRRHVAPQAFQALCIPPVWHGIPVPIAALARSLRGSASVIHVWTINDPARALRLWRLGVQGIISDDPATILAARRGGP